MRVREPRSLRRPTTALILVAFGLATACQLVANFDPVPKVERPPDVAPPKIVDPCMHLTPRPLPDVDDDSTGELPGQFFALRTFGVEANGEELDLDGVCTCDERANTFNDGAASCIAKQPSCDHDGGGDNKVAELTGVIAAVASIDINTAAARTIDHGVRNILIHVAGWNGKPNDREITTGLLISRGLFDPTGCGGEVNPDGGQSRYAPAWCGHDKWSYPTATTQVVRGERVPTLIGPAYVNDNVLVSKIEGRVTIFLGEATITISSPTIQARIEHTEAGTPRLVGILAGRIQVEEILSALGTFLPAADDAGVVSPICKQSYFPLVKEGLCGAVDIARTPSIDFTGQPCDAISGAFSFTAEPADLGEEFDKDDDPNVCDPTRVPQGTYSCQ